jgi:hypothetical protein
MDGVGAAGTAATFARADHVHPADTNKAADTAVVKLTGNQTVAGIKTLSSSPIVPTPTTDMQASTKKYVDDTAVALTGNQSVAGVKTFVSMPVLPIPGPFADDTAAATGGVAVHQPYFVTTTGVVQVRMA